MTLPATPTINNYPIPASSGTNKVPTKKNILSSVATDTNMLQPLLGSGASFATQTDVGGGILKCNFFGSYSVSATAAALLVRHTDYVKGFNLANTGSNPIYVSGRAAWVSNNASHLPTTIGSNNDDCFVIPAGQNIRLEGVHAQQLMFGCVAGQTSTLQVYGA
jgi:hypothetical protein